MAGKGAHTLLSFLLELLLEVLKEVGVEVLTTKVSLRVKSVRVSFRNAQWHNLRHRR